MKSFTLFTKDVVGEMNSKRRYETGRHEVIPSGGSREARAERHSAAVELFRMACDMELERQRRTVRDSVSKPVRGSMERLDSAIAALERSIPDHPGAGPTVGQLVREYQHSAEKQAQICAEAEAAYAARNPHRKGLYEGEDAVTKPADRFTDAAPARRTRDTARGDTFAARCRASEAAYAARNPHREEYCHG